MSQERLDCSGDFKSRAGYPQVKRADRRWRVCTAQGAKGQGAQSLRISSVWGEIALEGGPGPSQALLLPMAEPHSAALANRGQAQHACIMAQKPSARISHPPPVTCRKAISQAARSCCLAGLGPSKSLADEPWNFARWLRSCRRFLFPGRDRSCFQLDREFRCQSFARSASRRLDCWFARTPDRRWRSTRMLLRSQKSSSSCRPHFLSLFANVRGTWNVPEHDQIWPEHNQIWRSKNRGNPLPIAGNL